MNTLLDGRYDHIGIGRHDEDGPNDDVLRGRENYKRVVENEAATMLRRGKIKRFPFPGKIVDGPGGTDKLRAVLYTPALACVGLFRVERF